MVLMVLVVITVDWNQCASTLTQGMISSSGSQRRKKKNLELTDNQIEFHYGINKQYSPSYLSIQWIQILPSPNHLYDEVTF